MTILPGIGLMESSQCDGAVFVQGVNGIVQEVEKDLLQLTGVAGYGGQAGIELLLNGDIAVAGLILQKAGAFFQDMVHQDFLFGGFHAAGKTKQAVGYLFNPVHVVLDLIDGLLILMEIGTVGHVFLFEQILHPARFLGDHGQGVVDFVGDPGGHLAQGGHLAFVEHQFVALGFFQRHS